jgi:hypothetical protein
MVKARSGGAAGRVLKLALSVVGVSAGMALGGNSSAVAYTGIYHYSVQVSSSQAGGHPNIFIDTKFNNRFLENGESHQFDPESEIGCSCQDVRDIKLHFPTGFIGNPHAVPTCTLTAFALNTCPPDSQVGVVFFETGAFNPDGVPYEEKVGLPIGLVTPIFNLQPHPGEAGALGSQAPLAEIPIITNLSARTEGDYGLEAETLGIFHFLPIPELSLYIWGNPADPSHDRSRFSLPHDLKQNVCGGTIVDQVEEPDNPEIPYAFGCHPVVPSSVGNIPYLENPTRCGVPLSTSFELLYYDNAQAIAETGWPSTTGCDQLSFSPSLTAKPTTTQAETAAGIDIDLRVPQTQNPNVPSPSEIRSVTMTLPKGFTLNPGGADGKTSCSDSELNLNTRAAAHCPEFSKIGTSTLESSALPGPISGDIYLGDPMPGERFRIFLTADGFATHVKLKGTAELDPETGQIVTRFTDLPQSPFQDFDMHFFGSERGIFVTPTHCGQYTVETDFLPWDEALPTQTSVGTFTVSSGPTGTACPNGQRQFAPSLQAGTADNTAGVTTPLMVRLSRTDTDQFFRGVDLTLPTGLIQSIKGVTNCPESALRQLTLPTYTGLSESRSPACPPASQIGTVVSGAGAGSRNLYNPGKVYLAGPYKGAPLSVVTVVPALGGPYDLGNVSVRSGVLVDSRTAQVRTVSDPVPLFLEGVPLHLRSLLLTFNREGFNRTPTSCAPKSIDAVLHGNEGGLAAPDAFYQVANCKSLKFRPKLSLHLTGGVRRRGHPAIHAELASIPGEANLQTVTVTLPGNELLDNSHFGTVCTRGDFANQRCPTGALVGTAEVVTPLLDEALKGPVYVRASSHRLPDLALDLRGQVNLEVIGRIDSVKGRMRATFEGLPDAPVESVGFNLVGGAKGLLVNSEGLCDGTKVASVKMTGQNEKSYRTHVVLHAACGTDEQRRHRGKRGR